MDDVTKEHPNLCVYQFTRVVFGVSSSPFLLNATLKYHLEWFLKSNEAIVNQLLQSTYVDDVISGADTNEEAFELYTQAKHIFRQGGFNLRNFQTNSVELQRRIDIAERTPGAPPSTQSMPAAWEVKVLGVTWNLFSDTLVFCLSDVASATDDLQPTKRGMVSLIDKFYDPFGFLAPATIKFKIVLQQLCQMKIGWDCDLPEELVKEWRVLLADTKEAGPISVLQCYVQQIALATYVLCGFCDASTHAYAAVIYLR